MSQMLTREIIQNKGRVAINQRILEEINKGAQLHRHNIDYQLAPWEPTQAKQQLGGSDGLSQSLITKYNHYLAPYFRPIDEISFFDLLYDPETGLIGIEDYLVRVPELWPQWLEAIDPILDEEEVLTILNMVPDNVVLTATENRLINTLLNDEENGGDVGPFTEDDKVELFNLHLDILNGKIRLNDRIMESGDF
jgi:hypothetical protein